MMMQNADPKTQAGVVMPNLNVDEAVEKAATTIGAYSGAAITAGITGIWAFGSGVVRGAIAGAVNTFFNGQGTEKTPEQQEIERLQAELARARQS
jgi:hypothetical protein